MAQIAEGRRGGPYTDAARTFEHAGRELRRATVPTNAPGRDLRKGSAGLLRVRRALPSEQRQLLDLAHRLSALADAVARLRETQQQAAQAAAARQTAEQLLVLSGDRDRSGTTTNPAAALFRGQSRPHVAGPVPNSSARRGR